MGATQKVVEELLKMQSEGLYLAAIRMVQFVELLCITRLILMERL
jgi:hypothetical protein